MYTPKGITTTVGILIITIAIVIVGVAIFFVYQSTTNNPISLSITMEDRVAIELGESTNLEGIVTSDNGTDKISLTVDAPNEVTATVEPASIDVGDTVTLHMTGKSLNTNAEVTLTATQGLLTATHTISVNIFSTGVTNQVANIPITNSTNGNTNTATAHRFVNGDLNIAMDIPDTWGEVVIPELVKLKGVNGNMLLAYFSNVDRFDVPGFVDVTGATANYSPVQWDGTPLWFAGTVDAKASVGTIESQIRALGFAPYEVSVVKLDGREAVKMYYYFGMYSHYLSVAYLVPYQNSTYSTAMISRAIEKIAENEVSEADAIEQGKDTLAQLKARALSEQALRRFDEFETAIDSLTFIQ